MVKYTYAKAILIELFFLDNYTDRKRYLELGADKIADAIAQAIGKQVESPRAKVLLGF